MKKILKIFLYIILAILLLVIGVVVAINTPWGKDKIRKYAISFLQKKLDTKVEIGKIDFSIPSSVNLSKVLVFDKANDTLLWVNQLDVNVDMLKLISGRISVNRLDLDGADVHMYRTATDTNFNYQFIVDSFAGKKEASTQEVIDTAQASPIYLDAGTITITNTRYRLSDTIGGTLFGIRLNSLVLKPRLIDLNDMRFEVADFTSDTINSYFYSLPSPLPPSQPDTSEASNIILVVDRLKLNKASFAMKDSTSGLNFNIAAKEISAAMPWFSLLEKKIEIDQFNLVKTNSSLQFAKVKNKPKEPESVASTTEDSTSWRVLVNSLLLKDIGFAFDDENKPRLKDGIDYAHLDVKNFHLTGSDILYSVDTISGIIKNLTMLEKSGLDIQTMRTAFTYHSKGAVLDEFYLKTPHTLLQDKMAVSYRSLESLDKQMGKMNLDLAIRQSVVGFKDLFIFLPESQKKQLRDYRNQKVNLSLIAKGPLEALNINKLFLQGLTKTAIDASGVLYGLPDADKLRYDLNVKNLTSSYNDIKAFVPASVQQQINIPAWFAISGKISGTTTAYKPNLSIRTSDGDANINGMVNMSRAGKESYDLLVHTSGLNLGKILKMEDQLGKVTMDGKVKGVGFDPKTMDATIDANIAQAYFNGYNYTSLSANGHLRGKLGEIDLKSRDPNAFMSMKAYLDLSQKYPAITSNLNIEYLNLKELKWTTDDIVFTGDIDMDVPSANVDYPQARINVNHPFLTMNGTTYVLDSVYLYSNPVDSMQDISLSLGSILNARLTGHVPVTKMGDVILAHVNKFYRINDQKYAQQIGYDMNLSGTINYHRLFRQLVPELRPFDTVNFYALVDPYSLNLGLSAPKFRYADMFFDTLGFSAVEQDSALMYVLSLNRFTKGGIEFYNSALYGNVKNDSISSFLNLTDKQGVDQFGLGLYAALDKNDNIHLKMAKGLKLNYTDWTVNPLNRIVAGSGGFFIDQLGLNLDKQSIAVQSKDTVFNSPFNISIKNFTLSNLTKMISKDTILADGQLSVDADIDMAGAFPRILAKARLDSLEVYGAGLGNLALDAYNESADAYAAKMTLMGQGNDINIEGNYYTKPLNGNDLDFDANFKSLALKSLEGLTFGSIKNSSGTLWGKLKVTGSMSNLLVDGSLNTKDLTTTLAMFNTYLKMPNEKVQFVSGRGLNFNNFEIFDRLNRKATLSGDLLSKNFTDYTLNMRFNANMWEAMNSTSKDNESIYGRIIMSAALGLKGDMTAPEIDGSITIHDSTNFNYAMLDNPELVSNEGVVEFYDSKVIHELDEYGERLDRAKYLLSKSSSLNVNVDINKGAQFTVLVDPETGDKLNVKGTAFLNANLGSDGSMALTGTYELDDGYYDLSIEVFKKKFKIQKGSIIQLAGDPLDAEANITAIYEADAAPIDLLQAQVEGTEGSGQYRQKMPFQVLLKMSGKIMKPTISFDIVVASGKVSNVDQTIRATVEGKLNELRNNPTEMNKQVVAVLALNRFVSEDPFSSSGSGNAIENAVRQSASRFLSEQLNRMAGNLIAGIELDMGINSSEDFSTGKGVNRTDLNVTASKRLFNDRLKVSIGNDFQLEGQQTNTANPSYLPGNLSADYMITSDGRYVIRGYRKTELQNIINGFIVETGLSFRLGLEYNRFRQLLLGQKRYREFMRKRRQEERKKEEEAARLKQSFGINYELKRKQKFFLDKN